MRLEDQDEDSDRSIDEEGDFEVCLCLIFVQLHVCLSFVQLHWRGLTKTLVQLSIEEEGDSQVCSSSLKASYTSSFRPRTLVASGLIHWKLKASYTSSFRFHTLVA